MARKVLDFGELRQRAEQVLESRQGEGPAADARALQELMHEIEMYAVELELQNEELRRTRDELEIVKDRYRDLYELAPVAYFTLDRHGLIRAVNLAGADLLGLGRGSLVGRALMQFVAGQDHGRMAAALRDAAGGEGVRQLELQLRRGDGRPLQVWAELAWNATVAQDADDLRLVATDITERRRLEQQRNMFFSIASHELRTPITNISLALELAFKESDGHLTPGLREHLDVVWRGTQRLKRLVEDILQLRTMREGRFPLPMRMLDLVPLAQEAVMLNTPFAHRFEVDLVISQLLPEALVLGNADRLIQALNNLLTNAVKHSPPGSPVEIAVLRRDQVFRVSVTDWGPGIRADLRPRIFEPFTQGQPSLEDSRHQGSVGLGLSIGRAIVEQHGGRMDYVSVPGGETTFYFEIPQYGLYSLQPKIDPATV
jgi:PAS domain S-box-containing protein